MERVDAADLAEIMLRGVRMKLIQGQRICASLELELTLVDFDHECILAAADGTVAGREFRKFRLDFKAHCPAMARPGERFQISTSPSK